MLVERLSVIGLLVTTAIACHDSTSPSGIRETAATSLAAGDISTCALTSAGAAFCWGEDSLGQLGIGERPGVSHATPVAVGGAHTFAALSGSGQMMCTLTRAGQPWCWGATVLSLPSAFNDSLPTLISGSISLVTLSTGPFHSCGLTTGGDAYCWGQNSFGQLGTGDTLVRPTPVLVPGGHKWSAISAGFWHTCALTTNGTPYCWGYTGFGDLGNPTVDQTPSFTQLTPLAVAGGLTLASISAGTVYTCGLTAGGAGYCWGNNIIGQLGDGTDSSRDAPVPVAPASGLAFAKIFVSRANDIFATTCGVTSGGAAYCWGSGTNGQIGNPAIPTCDVSFGSGHFPCSQVPVAVTGGLTFASLAIGDLHVCGVTTAGAIDCWGSNRYGQLGDGTTQDSPAPTPVVGGLEAP